MLGLLRRTSMALPKEAYHSLVAWDKGHVRAAVVDLSTETGMAKMLGATSVPVHGLGRGNNPDLDRWYASCNRALTQAEDVTQGPGGEKAIADVLTMSVPSEVTRMLPVTASLRRQDAERAVTFDELRYLLQRGYRKAQDVIGLQGIGLQPSGEEFIHGMVAASILDGQSVVEPLGLRGRHLELHLSFSLMRVEWVRAFEIMAERLQMTLAAIVPQHVAYAAPLSDPAALLVLLDEHHTLASLVRHGRPEWSALAELGEREISGATSEAVGLRGRQADALMRAYRAGQLCQEVEQQLAQAFWMELRRWMVSVGDKIKGIKGAGSLPARLYFHDSTQRMPEAEPALRTPFWENNLPFERCPEVMALSPSFAHEVLGPNTQAKGAEYLALRTLAHYVAQLQSPSGVLERTLLDIVRARRAVVENKLR